MAPPACVGGLSVGLELRHASHWPAAPLTATVWLELHPSALGPAAVSALQVQAFGLEKRDTLWMRGGDKPTGVAAEVLQSAVQTLTAGASGDRIVFRSAAATPLTACCVLAPGERRCWEVEVALPAVLPPSHRGTALRWSYFLVATATLAPVGADAADAARPSQLCVRRPFRVWPSAVRCGAQAPRLLSLARAEYDGHVRWREVAPAPRGHADTLTHADTVPTWTLALGGGGGGGAAGQWQHAGDGGHFLTAEEMQHLPPASAAQADALGGAGDGAVTANGDGELNSAEARAEAGAAAAEGAGAGEGAGSGAFRRGRTYNLSFNDAPLVRFTPQAASTQYELSGVVSGLLTFHRDGPWRCAQVLVTLETEEVIPPQHTAAGASAEGGTIRKVHDEAAEVTADLVESHFLFSVPPDAEVSFGTPLMGLSWMLRFEFVVLPSASTEVTAGTAAQRMHWVMPLVVRPPHEAWCRAPELAQ